MVPSLPPLNALRAFEAAARHGNLARAAAELHVTPGALSHQIRALETLVGVTLFERQARGVALTAPGRALYPGLQGAFALMREAVATLRAQGGAGVLVVATPSGFTAKWLAPRLYRFAEAHPQIELRIAASAAYASFWRDGIDVAVRNLPLGEAAAEPSLVHEKLIDDGLVAVCSPALQAAALRDPRAVALIHDEQLAGRPEVPTWAHWFRAAGLAPPDLGRGLRFSSAEHAIEAAAQGAGLLLTHAVLVHDELRAGRLVQVSDRVLASGRAYFLVQPAGAPRPGIDAFAAWLREEMAAMAAP